MSNLIIPGAHGDDAERQDIMATEHLARMKALEEEVSRLNVVRASEVIDWFNQDEVFLANKDRVAILRDPTPAVTKSGLHLPSSMVQKRSTGTIVALSTNLAERKDPDGDAKWDGLQLAPGDRCTFSKYGESVHKVGFSNGKEVILDVLHVKDIYFYWRNKNNIDFYDPSGELY